MDRGYSAWSNYDIHSVIKITSIAYLYNNRKKKLSAII